MGRACSVHPGHPSSLYYFEWIDEGKRRDGTEKNICVVAKYVDTMRPRSIRRMGARRMPAVERYRINLDTGVERRGGVQGRRTPTPINQ
jgi:hypothetical protein